MTEIIRYSNEFLPHVVRLFYPNSEKVDARLDYFRHQFALYQPSPEQSCILLKEKDRLSACAYLTSLDKIQPGLVYMHLAVDRDIPMEQWPDFWERCTALAREIVPTPPILRIAFSGDAIPPILQERGFKLVREQSELHAELDQLPPMQADSEDFSVVTLGEQPEAEDKWLQVFNQGLTVFWDIPPLDRDTLKSFRRLPGFDFSAFRLGVANGEPSAALFYSVIDSSEGIVKINAAATPSSLRSKGFGRRMIRDTLSDLGANGYKTAVIFTDVGNQATNLLFKMLGFKPCGSVKILESRDSAARQPEPAAVQPETPEAEVAAGMDSVTNDPGFFPGLHSVYGDKKKK